MASFISCLHSEVGREILMHSDETLSKMDTFIKEMLLLISGLKVLSVCVYFAHLDFIWIF